MSEPKQHSDTAWNIASKYSHVLASETRDLAAHIDVALSAEREKLRHREALIERCRLRLFGHGPSTDPLFDKLWAVKQQDAMEPDPARRRAFPFEEARRHLASDPPATIPADYRAPVDDRTTAEMMADTVQQLGTEPK